MPRQRGASFQKTEVTIAGVRKSAIDAHPPYESIQGDHIRRDTSTFGEWTLSLPDIATPLYLDFAIGLREGSEKSDGVTFIVSIQGTEIFRRLYKSPEMGTCQAGFDTLSESTCDTPLFHDTRTRWKWSMGLGNVGRA